MKFPENSSRLRALASINDRAHTRTQTTYSHSSPQHCTKLNTGTSMSYPGLPPNEFAFWLSQQVQQGTLGQPQAPLNQFPIPQHQVPFGSQAFSYPATPQAQIPTGSFPTTANGAYSTAPLTMPFPVSSLPPQFPQIPLLQAGASAPVYENIWRSTPPYNEPVQSGTRPNDYPVNTQQVVPIRALQQNHAAPPAHYGDQSAATHLTTIHPSLGLCVLVPIGQLGASAPPSPGNWAVANPVGHRHRDHYSNRVDRLRRRHSRELTPYMRSMTPSPQRSPSVSPYLSSPSSTVTVTPVMHYRHYNTPEFGRSPRRFHGIGGFTPLRRPQSVVSVPRPSIEASPSTIATCSQCGGSGASPYEPFTDGSVTPRPRVSPADVVMGQGESSRTHGDAQEEPEDHRRFQASMEEVDE